MMLLPTSFNDDVSHLAHSMSSVVFSVFQIQMLIYLDIFTILLPIASGILKAI